MKKFTDKETARNMFSGIFAAVPIVMAILFLWGLLALAGFEVNLDSGSAKCLVIGLPVLFGIYWLLFKYYDRNNP